MANPITDMYFLAMVTLDGYLLAPPQERFSRSIDTYEDWCLLIPRTGSFAFAVSGGGQEVARLDDIVMCPPGGSLWRRMQAPTSFFHARFSTDLEPPIGRSRVEDHDRLRTDFAMLEAAQRHADMVAAHVVADIVLMLCRQRDAPEDELVRQATAYLRTHFASADLSLAHLAFALGISPAQLSRRFRAVHGVTPIAYLRTVRLRTAQRLLTESNDTLQVIAERCGFRSAFYFSRVFSRHTGESPSRYRHLPPKTPHSAGRKARESAAGPCRGCRSRPAG
ncbi:helix-turn-helix transcriptional regulator [Streptomyces sp. NPDC001508]|uniref:AraC family transcriptional regulator n=1 Tax=Streptomyces sp. NPDC001508 TaxID=3154656 RepID=UPI00331FEA0C